MAGERSAALLSSLLGKGARMPDVRASDPNPDDLTPEEQEADPTQPDEVTDNPEEQSGG